MRLEDTDKSLEIKYRIPEANEIIMFKLFLLLTDWNDDEGCAGL